MGKVFVMSGIFVFVGLIMFVISSSVASNPLSDFVVPLQVGWSLVIVALLALIIMELRSSKIH